jgi:membrane dipeptidase
MNRRTFARHLLASPALLSSLSSAALSGLCASLASAAKAADSPGPGLDNEVDALLKTHFVIDAAPSDTFFPHSKAAPPQFNPNAILGLIGGAVLGIGPITGQVPTFLPEDSLLRKSTLATPHIGLKPLLDGPHAVERTLGEIEATYQAVNAHPHRAGVALSAGDMEALHRAGKLALVLGLDTGYEIGNDLAVLDAYHRLGLRKLAVTHEVAPSWAESDTSDRPTGLQPFGREVIAECNRLGVMVDISHSSDLTFWGVLTCARRPVIATHSGARQVAPVARNLGDDMIRALAKNGGFIGVGGILNQQTVEKANNSGHHYQDAVLGALWLQDKYPDPEAFAEAWYDPAKQEEARKALNMASFPSVGTILTDPESTLAHLDYITNLIGFDHVGIGTDLLMSWAPLYPNMIRGIAAGLITRKYSEEKIAKILGGNFLRVFRDNA